MYQILGTLMRRGIRAEGWDKLPWIGLDSGVEEEVFV